MNSLMSDTLQQYRTQITTHIETETTDMTKLMTDYTNQMIEMIEAYTVHMQTLIAEREQALIELIKSQAKRVWVWIAIGSVLCLILGAAIGATIAKSVIDSPILIFQQEPIHEAEHLLSRSRIDEQRTDRADTRSIASSEGYNRTSEANYRMERAER